MSPKKKKRAEKIEIAKEKPKRKLISFTAGKIPSVSKAMPPVASAIPSVSKAMPPVASAIPLVSKEIPLVSKPIPLVSATPPQTLAKKWGLPNKKWGTSKIRPIRRWGPTRPKDIGLFKALGETMVSPVMGPMKMVEGIASVVKAQTEEERELKVALEQELLELKMRREMNEVSEEDYKIEEAKLKRRIKDLEEKEKAKGETKESEEKHKKKKGRKKKRR